MSKFRNFCIQIFFSVVGEIRLLVGQIGANLGKFGQTNAYYFNRKFRWVCQLHISSEVKPPVTYLDNVDWYPVIVSSLCSWKKHWKEKTKKPKMSCSVSFKETSQMCKAYTNVYIACNNLSCENWILLIHLDDLFVKSEVCVVNLGFPLLLKTVSKNSLFYFSCIKPS